jgi:hypothetical protein
MQKIVIDTNVIVSALIQRSYPNRIIAELFIENKLAGINSFVAADDGKPNSNYGDESGHTRMSLYYNWILEQMKEPIDD